MQVQLTDDQQAFIQEGIQAGRFAREEDARHEALSLWEVRERRRAEILAAVDQAEAARLADDIKRRGLARSGNITAAAHHMQNDNLFRLNTVDDDMVND